MHFEASKKAIENARFFPTETRKNMGIDGLTFCSARTIWDFSPYIIQCLSICPKLKMKKKRV
jgi:hypothetical protein